MLVFLGHYLPTPQCTKCILNQLFLPFAIRFAGVQQVMDGFLQTRMLDLEKVVDAMAVDTLQMTEVRNLQRIGFSVIGVFVSTGGAVVLNLFATPSNGAADALAVLGRKPQFTYGYLSRLHRKELIADTPSQLKQVLARNRTGSILVSTSRTDRLADFVDAAEAERC